MKAHESWLTDSRTGIEFEIGQKLPEISKLKSWKFFDFSNFWKTFFKISTILSGILWPLEKSIILGETFFQNIRTVYWMPFHSSSRTKLIFTMILCENRYFCSTIIILFWKNSTTERNFWRFLRETRRKSETPSLR